MNELSRTETAVITQAGERQERADGSITQQDSRTLQTSWKPVVPDQQHRKCSFRARLEQLPTGITN